MKKNKKVIKNMLTFLTVFIFMFINSTYVLAN